MSELLQLTDRGLFCEAGGFYVDPWGAVDRAVIDITQSREDYLDALLAIAGSKPQLDLAPAPDPLPRDPSVIARR